MLRRCLPAPQDVVKRCMAQERALHGASTDPPPPTPAAASPTVVSAAAAVGSHPGVSGSTAAGSSIRESTEPLLRVSNNRLLARATACVNRARVFMAEGRHLLAEAQLTRTREIAERLVRENNLRCANPHLILIGCLLHQKDLPAARELALDLYHQLGERNRAELDGPLLHLVIAHVSRRLGQAEDAIAFLRMAASTYPSDPEPCAALSELLTSVGRFTSGADAARMALEKDTSSLCRQRLRPSARSAVSRCLAECLAEQGEFGEGLKGVARTRDMRVPQAFANPSRSSVSRPWEKASSKEVSEPSGRKGLWFLRRTRSKTFGVTMDSVAEGVAAEPAPSKPSDGWPKGPRIFGEWPAMRVVSGDERPAPPQLPAEAVRAGAPHSTGGAADVPVAHERVSKSGGSGGSGDDNGEDHTSDAMRGIDGEEFPHPTPNFRLLLGASAASERGGSSTPPSDSSPSRVNAGEGRTLAPRYAGPGRFGDHPPPAPDNFHPRLRVKTWDIEPENGALVPGQQDADTSSEKVWLGRGSLFV